MLAGVSAVLLWSASASTVWAPYDGSRYALGEGLVGLAWLMLAAAPIVALRAPWVAAGMFLAPLLLTLQGGEWPLVLFGSGLLSAVVAAWRSTQVAVALLGLVLLPVATYTNDWTTIQLPYGGSVEHYRGVADGLIQLGLYALVCVLVFGLALWLRHAARAARVTTALRARAGAVERDSAVFRERAQLAHDLHDVVAHHVSLIAVRPETAPYTVGDLSPGAREVLSEIAQESRRALDELRGVLGVLRRTSQSEVDALRPQPGPCDLATLVDQARAAGSEVAWESDDLKVVPSPVGYVAYRVVQECLTNARRHAVGAPVRLVTRLEGGVLVIRATNPVGAAPVAEGRGLVGVRERVAALGGTASVAVVDAVLVVEARLPL